MIFTLVEATATRLRYKVQAENNANSESGVVTNNSGGSPGGNLALDSFASSALRTLVTTGAATTGAAQTLLQGDGLAADAVTPRAHVGFTDIVFNTVDGSPVQWIVSVDTGSVLDGGSTGFACIGVEVHGLSVQGAQIYLDIGIPVVPGGGPAAFVKADTVTAVDHSDLVNTLVASFSFDIAGNPACWSGLPSYFELKLMSPLSNYALEQLRTRFLFAVTTNHDSVKSARAELQMAFETEIGVTLTKLITVPADVFTSLVCERRRFLEIDADMAAYNFLVNPALTALLDNAVLPAAYVNLLQVHLQSPYARYRVCAMAALLCLAAQFLIPDVSNSVVLSFADSTSCADAITKTKEQDYIFADTVSVDDNIL